MSAPPEIEEQAASWLAREDKGLGDADRAQLQAWLDGDMARRVAYLRLKAVWRRADRLAALKTPVLGQARATAIPRDRTRYSIAGAFALAATLVLAFYLYGPRDNAYETGIGRQKTIHLSDGTQIELNTGTRLVADVTSTARTITLDHGEAYFDVVHDPARPFVVLAGDRRIVDLGTRFSVRRDGDNVQVMVAQGRVRVDVLGARGTASTVLAKTDEMVLAKGSEALIARKSAQDVEDALDWRNGMLVFNQETLADVAREFNRYNQRQMVVTGGARDIRLGGSFRADNLDAFAALIEKGLGLKIESKDKQIIVSRQ
jgi:transmembrane sensor